MGEKIVVGPINQGLRTDRTPFVIDNDSFPTLLNAYQWRGRVKRKRGTSLLGRLQRYLGSTDGSGNLTVTIYPPPEDGISSIKVGSNIFTDPGGTGTVNLVTNGPGTATLVRTTGVLTITGSNPSTPVVYFPCLPVMGIEDLAINSTQFPGNIVFDTRYSYNIPTNSPYTPYDVSFYKNPPNGTYAGYTAKGTPTSTSWNGENYQQFWTTNYEGALWATNGVDVNPTTLSKIGMQYKVIATVDNITAGPPAFVDITFTTSAGLLVGDFLFINEVQTTTGINFQTGYVTAINVGGNPNKVTVEFSNATIANNGSGGIAQYLTNRADKTKDCLRFYDGDPTTGSFPPSFSPVGNGWVNFSPPLNNLTLFPNFSIADLPPAQYYLVGAKMIVPFKDRLLFLGPVIQTSAADSQVYLQDTIIYSQNGTPYYTCSFTGDPSLATTVFNPILVPSNQNVAFGSTLTGTATATAYWEDLSGYGGFIQAGVSKPIVTVGNNEDVLIVGFSTLQTKLVYTGNDLVPFQFYQVNAELGSGSTFSSIILDQGVLTRGSRGFVITNQTGTQRFDLDILDNVFEINLQNNGSERFTAQRDFVNEWVYFTYLSNETNYTFPNQTLFYNYRDNSWGVFNESFTTYGQFRPTTGLTWNTAPIWNGWNDPWNSGSNTLYQPQVIAGNQQGFILFREDESTTEATSLVIQSISGNVITSPNHCINENDYIYITGCLGTVGSLINDQIFQVLRTTNNTIELSAPPVLSGTYFGGGLITRLYIPQIQTKQFPVNWGMSRKTKLGVQQYLLTKTSRGQMTLLVYLSQNRTSPYNAGPIVPEQGSVNDSLIYSTVLYTCPESTNLGLTPSNINLQMVTGSQQSQIWHRINTSLIGDTVQVGFTLSDEQMTQRDQSGGFISQFEEIEIHGIILDVTPSQVLA